MNLYMRLLLKCLGLFDGVTMKNTSNESPGDKDCLPRTQNILKTAEAARRTQRNRTPPSERLVTGEDHGVHLKARGGEGGEINRKIEYKRQGIVVRNE